MALIGTQGRLAALAAYRATSYVCSRGSSPLFTGSLEITGFSASLPVPSPKDSGVEEGEAKLTGQGLCLGSQPTSQGSAISLLSFEFFFFLLFFCASFKG